MRQSLVPVLLLTAVALSSSNVLPMISSDRLQSISADGQQNDNILSNKYNTRNVLNSIFYTVPISTWKSNRLLKKITKYLNTVNNRAGNFDDIVNEDDNYDGEGFRKEQWHNYPRQLDRLHEYLSNYPDDDVKRSPDTDDPGFENYDASISKERVMDDSTNEYVPDSNEEIDSIYDSVEAANNPLLVLKMHLAYFSNRLRKAQETKPNMVSQAEYMTFEKGIQNQEENPFTNEINPATKVKREGATPQDSHSTGENSVGETKTVNKRLFSLWSRLQSLSHKGHELPHRRHLAFYGFPEGEGGSGTLTAETRATFMRPPGSPLRWG